MIVKESDFQTYTFLQTERFEWKIWSRFLPWKGIIWSIPFQKYRQQQTCDQLELSSHDLEKISKQKNQVPDYTTSTRRAVCSAAQDQSKSWNNKAPSLQFYLTLSNSEESLGKMNVGQTTSPIWLQVLFNTECYSKDVINHLKEMKFPEPPCWSILS